MVSEVIIGFFFNLDCNQAIDEVLEREHKKHTKKKKQKREALNPPSPSPFTTLHKPHKTVIILLTSIHPFPPQPSLPKHHYTPPNFFNLRPTLPASISPKKPSVPNKQKNV